MYNIPLFDLNFPQEEADAAVETIRSKWISTCPRCEEPEGMILEKRAVIKNQSYVRRGR